MKRARVINTKASYSGLSSSNNWTTAINLGYINTHEMLVNRIKTIGSKELVNQFLCPTLSYYSWGNIEKELDISITNSKHLEECDMMNISFVFSEE